MTRQKFERIARATVVRVAKNECNLEITENDLEVVLFAQQLGYKPSIFWAKLWAKKMDNYCIEVLYDSEKKTMSVTIYVNYCNVKMNMEEEYDNEGI